MADAVFGALQTAEAIAGLICLTKKVIDYCRRLARAETTANRILKQIEGFKTVLEGYAVVIGRQRGPNLERISQDERAQLVAHIDAAVQGCQHTLQGMEALFQTIFFDSGTDLLSSINARRRFLSHENQIHELVGQLEGQKITLLIAFAILGFYDQQRSSCEDETANTRIRELSIQINHGYEYFCHWIDVRQPLKEVSVDSLSLLNADVSAEVYRTFADLLSVRDLAKDVRRRLKTSRSLSGGRKDSNGDTILIEEVDTRSTSWLEPLRTLDSAGSTSPPIVDDQSHDFLHIGIATGRKIRSISNVGMLDYSLNHCLEYARKCQRDSNFDLAEQHLEKAIAYSEQREKLKDGAPFSDRTTLLEELAHICREVYNWTAAIRILKYLLRRRPRLENSGEPSNDEDFVHLARQNQLLASVLFDKCCLKLSESDQTLDEALERATEAWSLWESKAKTRQLDPVEQSHWQSCVRLLEQIWECKGEFVEASFYGHQLRQFHSATTHDVWCSEKTEPPFTYRGCTSMDHTTDINHRLHAFDTAKRAATTADIHTIQQLFGTTGSCISINEQFDSGQTILHYAASKGMHAVVQQLLRLGADVGIMDVLQETALVKAISNDHSETVRILLQWPCGAVDLHTKLLDGRSLLHYAVQYGGIETMRVLLEADRTLINLRDCDGQTALHRCAEHGDREKAGFLLDFQPDYTAKDARDRTPGNHTLTKSNSNHQQVFGLLMDHHASKNPGLPAVDLIGALINKSKMSHREATNLNLFSTVYRRKKKMDLIQTADTFGADLTNVDSQLDVRSTDQGKTRKSIFRWKRG